jgi:post-segregation antitoxin (ccd killing protein)
LTGDDRKKTAARPSKAKSKLGSDPERSKRAQQWLEENWEALESSNRWVEEHGLPFAKYRLF